MYFLPGYVLVQQAPNEPWRRRVERSSVRNCFNMQVCARAGGGACKIKHSCRQTARGLAAFLLDWPETERQRPHGADCTLLSTISWLLYQMFLQIHFFSSRNIDHLRWTAYFLNEIHYLFSDMWHHFLAAQIKLYGQPLLHLWQSTYFNTFILFLTEGGGSSVAFKIKIINK